MNARVLQASPAPTRCSEPVRRLSAEERARGWWLRGAGDANRQRELLARTYAANKDAVQAFARRRGATGADAEDLCADVFVVALRRISTYRGESTIRTWLLGIAVRLLADRRRSAAHRCEVLTRPPRTAGDGDDAEAMVLDAERRAQLHRAVEDLPNRLGAVVRSYHLEEAPMSAVARAEQVPLQTAYARLYAGRARLREQLSALG